MESMKKNISYMNLNIIVIIDGPNAFIILVRKMKHGEICFLSSKLEKE